MIDFNIPTIVGTELGYIEQAIQNKKISGDGCFSAKCSEWFEKKFGSKKVMLTTSGSAALDMAAFLCGIEPGDEVILPSYTFPSTANSFVLAGAKLIFVDIRPDTMNIDETKIESAITNRTKVIAVVHYAGVSCEMDTIMDIAKKYNLLVVEDAAQGVMSTYKGRHLGTIGNIGCYSFHETKNYTMGEGGALLINDEKYINRAEIMRDKGTNRSQFFRGLTAKYNWVDWGDSYLQSDMNAAFLWAQLEKAEEINNRRLDIWNSYYNAFKLYEKEKLIELPAIPYGCVHNAHMFYLKFLNLDLRQKYIAYMKSNGVQCVFHYVPLHSAPGGMKYGYFAGEDRYTTKESDRIVRLPLYYSLKTEEVNYIVRKTIEFIEGNKG